VTFQDFFNRLGMKSGIYILTAFAHASNQGGDIPLTENPHAISGGFVFNPVTNRNNEPWDHEVRITIEDEFQDEEPNIFLTWSQIQERLFSCMINCCFPICHRNAKVEDEPQVKQHGVTGQVMNRQTSPKKSADKDSDGENDMEMRIQRGYSASSLTSQNNRGDATYPVSKVRRRQPLVERAMHGSFSSTITDPETKEWSDKHFREWSISMDTLNESQTTVPIIADRIDPTPASATDEFIENDTENMTDNDLEENEDTQKFPEPDLSSNTEEPKKVVIDTLAVTTNSPPESTVLRLRVPSDPDLVDVAAELSSDDGFEMVDDTAATVDDDYVNVENLNF